MNCPFCKIVSGVYSAEIVGETERSLAFKDISPRQPVHILVIPKQHHENIAELSLGDPEALIDLMQLGSRVAREQTDGHYRFTFNTGEEAGQTVFHAHGHITSTRPAA